MQLASPKRHHTLLFSPTDERWKAVRKSVATAFSVANMRALYPKIRDACAKVSTSRICGVVASSQSVSGHHMQCTACQYAPCPAAGHPGACACRWLYHSCMPLALLGMLLCIGCCSHAVHGKHTSAALSLLMSRHC